MKKSFVFGVITYNHSDFIIEHLESIRFLIEKYGSNYSVKLVIADDGSKDDTVKLIKSWVSQNSTLFSSFVLLADGINRGTCINYTNIWEHVDSEFFKITAGDDVFSFENLFETSEQLLQYDYLSGYPLLLINQEIVRKRNLLFHLVASDVIFSKRGFKKRVTEIGVLNTPSIFFNYKFIRNQELYSYIRQFRVVEDFPMMVKISSLYNNVSFRYVDKVLVYYRRTSNSIYLIREDDFNLDKEAIFRSLIEDEKSFWKKMLFQNRLFLFKSKNIFLKKVGNLNYYIYLARVFCNISQIVKRYASLPTESDVHQLHYNLIRMRAERFMQDLESSL